MVLGVILTAIRQFNIILLFALNVTMVVIFRKRNKKVGEISISNDKKEQERKAADKNLLALTICQSILMALAHIPQSAYLLASFMSATFDQCYGGPIRPTVDACICVADAIDLFVVIGINKKMRQTVLRVLPCCGEKPSSGVTPTNALGQAT